MRHFGKFGGFWLVARTERRAAGDYGWQRLSALDLSLGTVNMSKGRYRRH